MKLKETIAKCLEEEKKIHVVGDCFVAIGTTADELHEDLTGEDYEREVLAVYEYDNILRIFLDDYSMCYFLSKKYNGVTERTDLC